MDSLLEQLSELKIAKQEYNLSRTGLVFDSSLLEEKNVGSTLRIAYDKLKQVTCNRFVQLTSRDVKEDESVLLNSKDSLSDPVLNRSLGNSLELIDQLIKRDIDNGIALVNTNPTRHLAQLCLDKYNLKRVLIVNWDLRHDYLTQKSFYDTTKVLTLSIHQYDPERQESDFDLIGEDSSKGYNVNIPLRHRDYGNSEYISIFYNVVLPIVYEYSPEIVLISTNFNACQASTEANVKIHPLVYAHLLNALSCLADGRLALFVNSQQADVKNAKLFAECVAIAGRQLLGFPCPRIKALAEPNNHTIETINNVVAVQRPYWYSLQHLNDSDESITLDEFIQNHKKQASSFIKPEPVVRTPGRPASNSAEKDLNEALETESRLTGRTCICTDDRMTLHFHPADKSHPEQPDRIRRIMAALKEKNLFQECTSIESRQAREEEIELCHTKSYIEEVRGLKNKSGEELMDMSIHNRNSVYFNVDTYDCALWATGCLLNVVDQVCSKKFTNGVSVSRPPGHHADCKSCSGFCFFNSVAVAARYAQKKHRSVKKVLILDFDIHHGNGTQDIFKDDDSVLFISLHRYDGGNFYPAGADSNYNFVGIDKGKGLTVNVPWNMPTGGDAEYVAAFLRVVMPIAYQFNPDLVLVSAGFDGAVGDPLGRFNITVDGYAQMTKMLSSFANGNVILVLEGGYNLTSISESMSSCVSTLLGKQITAIPPVNAKPQAYVSIKNVQLELAPFWSCFRFNGKLPSCNFVKLYKKPKGNNLNNTNDSINLSQSGDIPYSLRQRKNRVDSPSNSPRASPRINSPAVKSVTEVKPSMSSTPSSARTKPATTPATNVLNDLTNSLAKTNISEEQVDKKKEEPTNEEAAGAAIAGVSSHNDLFEFVIDTVDDAPVPVAVVPLSFCPHLLELNQELPEQINAKAPCHKCQSTKENWLCLCCFQCMCSRYVKGHMTEHFDETKHPMVLSFSDLSVWCYECEYYVHNDLLTRVKQMAYDSKFQS